MSDRLDTVLKIGTREELEAWLQTQPLEVEIMIAGRAALRVAPFAAFEIAPRGGRQRTRNFLELTLSVFRANAIARYVAKFGRVEVGFTPYFGGPAYSAVARPARKAGMSAACAADAAFGKPIYGSRHGVAAVGHAMEAAQAAGASPERMWRELSADANLIADGASISSVISQKLFHFEIPLEIIENWAKLRKALPADKDWDVWYYWYDGILSGGERTRAYEGAFVPTATSLWFSHHSKVNKWIKEHLPEEESETTLKEVPSIEAATIEPVVHNEVITLRDLKPSELDPFAIEASLAALKDQFRGLANDLDGKSNIDRAFVEYLHTFADRIPAAANDPRSLFALGHELAALRGYDKTVANEWPPLLASRYFAAELALDNTLRQFPTWRSFVANVSVLTSEQVEGVIGAAHFIAGVMRLEALRASVDARLPDTLESLAKSASELGSPIPPMEANARNEVARDTLESINNILKVETAILLDEPEHATITDNLSLKAAGAISGATHNGLIGLKFASAKIEEGVKKAAENILTGTGKALVYGSVLILALLASHLTQVPILIWLISNFPTQFGWLKPILEHLKLI